jgi:DNA-directed RNA polymerase subunit RPC12/RpoP
VPPSGIGQAVTFFEKRLKKVAISPNPLWQALHVMKYECANCKHQFIDKEGENYDWRNSQEWSMSCPHCSIELKALISSEHKKISFVERGWILSGVIALLICVPITVLNLISYPDIKWPTLIVSTSVLVVASLYLESKKNTKMVNLTKVHHSENACNK